MQFIIKFIFEWNTIAQFFYYLFERGANIVWIWNNLVSKIFDIWNIYSHSAYLGKIFYWCIGTHLSSSPIKICDTPTGLYGRCTSTQEVEILDMPDALQTKWVFLVYYFSFFLLLQSTSIIFVDWVITCYMLTLLKKINIINFTCQGDILMNFVALFLALFYELSVVLHIFRLFLSML